MVPAQTTIGDNTNAVNYRGIMYVGVRNDGLGEITCGGHIAKC